jgi:hypothetical protein
MWDFLGRLFCSCAVNWVGIIGNFSVEGVFVFGVFFAEVAQSLSEVVGGVGDS